MHKTKERANLFNRQAKNEANVNSISFLYFALFTKTPTYAYDIFSITT